MRERLTTAQKATLERIMAENDAGRSADKNRMGLSTPVLDRLLDRGFIASAKPFAWAYHNVDITPAGRAALEGGGK